MFRCFAESVAAPASHRRRSMDANLVIGKQFPDLELSDHRGELVQLSKLAGEYPLVLSFYRGYW